MSAMLAAPTLSHHDAYVLEILREAMLLSREQSDAAAREAGTVGGVLAAIAHLGLLTEEDVGRALASHSNMEFIDLDAATVPASVAAQIPAALARRHRAVPLGEHDGALTLAIADPLDFDSLDSLRYQVRRDVEFVAAAPAALGRALVKLYGTAEEAADRIAGGLGSEFEVTGLDAENTATEAAEGGDAPIIKLVSMMILEAYKMRASDIHLEPLEKRLRVRFRVDGVLQEMSSPPKRLQSAILSRLKIMTGTMSIAEKRLPQDGRIQVRAGSKSIDLRVSTVPTNHGESIVMRILDKSSLLLGLPELGFLSDDQEIFERLVRLPDGILLVTGPTGSGKTTTLYASLHYLNKPDRKIITVEDPVEYQLSGINQVQVMSEIGMTFPAALRSMLRQAPNIIMIGEIRDLETASIAINASLTGHLVFSTLHTNDAPSAVARLVDMGVKPFLVASSVRAILAQRLVRKLCANCRQPAELDAAALSALGLTAAQVAGSRISKAVGCELCRHRGYKGRMGIFEILEITDEIRHMINEGQSTLQLRQRARERGMRTLREDGVRKVLAGLTTAEEVITASTGA